MKTHIKALKSNQIYVNIMVQAENRLWQLSQQYRREKGMAEQHKHRKKGMAEHRKEATVYFAVDNEDKYYIGSTEWPEERMNG